MNFEGFEKELTEKLRKINIEINKEQVQQFYDYMNLLIEWNEKINLTAITDPSEIILKHFVDSAIIAKHIKGKEIIADIGTGAGFPGIPLKIIKPDNQILLVDSLNKRIKFLEEVIKQNKVKNISTIHARVEEIGQKKEYRNNFDIVTSRAVAKLNVLLEYMLPLLKVGGRCICLKGPNIEQEVKEAKNALKILGGEIKAIEEITLPDSDNKRTVIEILSVKHSPNKYPRKAGTPVIEPL